MDCPEKRREGPNQLTVWAAFPPREPLGTWGCFPSEQDISWGKEKAKQPRLASPPHGGETSRTSSCSHILRDPLCKCVSAPWGIQSTGCSSQGQLELLGMCWVPNGAGCGSRRRRLFCLMEDEAGAVGWGVEICSGGACFGETCLRVVERWLRWYPAHAQGLGAAGPLGATIRLW